MRAAMKFASAALVVLTLLLVGTVPSEARDREHGRFGRHHHFEGRRFHRPVFIGAPPFVWGPGYVYAYPPYAPGVVLVPPPPAVWIRVR